MLSLCVSAEWSLHAGICVCVFVGVKERQRMREREREKAEISIRGGDYPVKRLPATWSSSPLLTPSHPHPLSHHPQYWRGLSEQVIRGNSLRHSVWTTCSSALASSSCLPGYSVNIFDFSSCRFWNFPFSCHFSLGVHLPSCPLFFGHDVLLYNVILTWRHSALCVFKCQRCR